MKTVHNEELRRDLRTVLNEVESAGEHYQVLRYQVPAAVIVPVEWYELARDALGKAAQRPQGGD